MRRPRPGLPMLHRAWRLLPQGPRRELLARASALLAPRPGQPSPAVAKGVIVAGELTRASGLGESARIMIRALERIGVPAWPIDVGPLLPAHSADLPSFERPLISPPPDAALVLHVNPPLLPLILRRLPPDIVRGRRVVGYWAWELGVLPRTWLAGSRFVHEAWAPSEFTADAITVMTQQRARVVPHPLAAVPPVAEPVGRDILGWPEDAVIVLAGFNIASSFERKNPLAAIAAFRMAFGNRNDRVLVLKATNPGHATEDFARLRAAVSGLDNVLFETRILDTERSHAMTAAADIVISLHRSEGFGLVPAEAMILGRPVVATGWSGNMSFMDQASAALIDYRLVPARDPRGVYEVPGAVWAEPEVEQAAARLRDLADNEGLRKCLGAAGRQAALRHLGIEPLVNALREMGLSVPG